MMVSNYYMFIMPIILLPSNVHRYNPDVKINSVDRNVIIVFPQVFPTPHVQCSCFNMKKKHSLPYLPQQNVVPLFKLPVLRDDTCTQC